MAKYKDDYSGIYGIYCFVDNKWYVGRSKTVKSRQSRHKTDLRKNKHPNNHLQNAWNKYGEDSFAFPTLEKCSPEYEVIHACETKWCLHYQAHLPEFGYCMDLPDKKDPDTIKKILASRSKNTEEYSNPVIGINKQTGEITKFNSPIDISKELNLKITKIQKVLGYWSKEVENKSYHKRSYKDFIFIYEKDYDPEFEYTSFKKKRTVFSNIKTVIATDTEGNDLEFESVKACSEFFNILYSRMFTIMHSKHKSHDGYTFKYK